MTDFELLLLDRIGIIKSANDKYDLEHNAYLSFSGGKDSTILHYLLDEALPGNKIPRVYVDTGIEYFDVREFVFDFRTKDSRFYIIKPSSSVKQILNTYGYPFKSKEHSHILSVYQNSGLGKSVSNYLGLEGCKMITCPNILKYQFSSDFSIKVSDKCCLKLKKEPFKHYQKSSGRTVTITGMRKQEGGQRMKIKGCILTDDLGNLIKFHPLLVVSDEWEEWYLNLRNINLCKLYSFPFNFRRTGCKGCPFALDLQEQLSIMDIYLPNERKQCEFIWAPVYAEYRRIGYRLSTHEQMRLF